MLLDDDFSSIVAAVRLGRRIFDNIKKAIAFILAVHVPIAGLSMLPVFFADWPLLLLPVHIVFLELIIDPVLLAHLRGRGGRGRRDAAAAAATRRAALLDADHRARGAAGLSVLAVCLGVFLLARTSHTPDAARALTFATLVVAFLVIILVNRSWTRTALAMLRVPNAALRWVVLGTCSLLAVVLSFQPRGTSFTSRRCTSATSSSASAPGWSASCGSSC